MTDTTTEHKAAAEAANHWRRRASVAETLLASERTLSAQLKREVDANIARADALAQERDAAMKGAETLTGAVERLSRELTTTEAERDAARAEVERLRERVAWLEEIREGAGRALCAMDGIAPDEPIADGGHVAWELHVYQRAHAALAAKENEQ